jgi:molecular chaperone GrpE
MAPEHDETTTVPASPDPAPASPEGDPLVNDEEGSRHGAPPAEDGDEDSANGAAADGASAPAAEAEAEAPADPLTEAQAERDRYLDLARRTQADFENYRKRMSREVRVAEGRGAGKLARELFAALDTLDHALAAEVPEGPFGDGIKLVQNELRAALARAGIEAYAPKGEPFDPQIHEAVSQLPVEGVEKGTVFEVMQSGYRHGDTVLRPARVVVAA